MDFIVSGISKILSEIQDRMGSVKTSFNSSWTDQVGVHDSFGDFIILCNKNINKLIEINSRSSELCRKLNELDIDKNLKDSDENINKSDELVKRVNELVGRKI